jgi:serine/threonine-protein kinase
MSFQVGDTVGDYEIIGVLGAGGMGRVYKVRNTISDRVDALKVLLPNLADDQALADRFMREIKVLASLDHPNIAGLRTAFRLENQLLMVMEFVEGITLEERLKQGRIPIPDAIGYITQVLAALGYAHKRGVIHRDIKPANMMLTPENVIKLMDFGIAKSKSDRKLTQTGTTMGSLFYMSGEQVQGEELDGRSDLYSVGVSLYELVTGCRPFQGKSDFDIMIAQLQQAPMPPIQIMPEIPKALNDIIVISLEKDRAKRFQTAEAFAAALGSVTVAQINSTPMQAARTDLMPTVTAPGPSTPVIPTPAVAVGGAISAPRGYPPIAAPPAVTPTGAPAAATDVLPPDPSHGVPAPGTSKGYRGLYMTFGALIALAVIVVAATQLPRILKTHAGDRSAQATQAPPPNGIAPATAATDKNAQAQSDAATASSTSGSAPTPAAGQPNGAAAPGSVNPSPVASVGAASTPPAPSASGPPASPGKYASRAAKKSSLNLSNSSAAASGGQPSAGAPVASGGGEAVSAAAVSAPGQTAQPAADNKAANAQELAEISELHDKLAVRAVTMNDRVDNLRKEMAAGGNNLRSDISATQTRMKMYMDKFDAALNAGDPVAAKKYMSLAESAIDTLEKFFGQ